MTPYYADDLVTLYLGDCRELLPEITKPDMVMITDPPYGIAWNVGTDRHRGYARTRRGAEYTPIVGDADPFDPSHLLALGLPTVLFGAQHFADRLPISPSWVVWDKRIGMNSNDQSDCELAWTNLGGPVRIFRLVWNGGARPQQDRLIAGRTGVMHPSQKPLGLMRWLIGRCPEGPILDPYAGSGTTLVAAKSLGRRAIGIEIEARWADLAATRCSQEVLGLAI